MLETGFSLIYQLDLKLYHLMSHLFRYLQSHNRQTYLFKSKPMSLSQIESANTYITMIHISFKRSTATKLRNFINLYFLLERKWETLHTELEDPQNTSTNCFRNLNFHQVLQCISDFNAL